jgi:uncharacterized protein (TIGR02147 family)
MELNSYNPKLDYRFLLKQEFQLRRQKNAAYSLRAFAQSLDLSAAYLSQIFSGKRTLSEAAAQTISEKFRWSHKRRQIFFSLVRYTRAQDSQSKARILEQLQDLSEVEFFELKQDQFQLISEWFHFAIVELSDVKGFRPEADWIAKRLGITSGQADEAVKRLLRLGLLKKSGGVLKKAEPFHRIKAVPSAAIRTFHQTNLQRAGEALKNQDFSVRDFSGTTVAINKKNIVEVKQLIQEFRDKLNRFCAKSDEPDAVYQLAVQFFRVDQKSNENVRKVSDEGFNESL